MAERSAVCGAPPNLLGASMPDLEGFDSGRRSWLEQQFVRYAAFVRAVIWNRLSRVRDPHLVEELAAETWARAVRGVQKPEFDAARDFAPWVCAIAANVCREHFRRQQRSPDPGGLPQPDDLHDPDDYKRVQELLELHRALAECLACLTAAERKVYELRFGQGLSGRAAAEALSVPESTFREKILPELLVKLAHCLAGKGFEEVLSSFLAHRPQVGQWISERRTP